MSFPRTFGIFVIVVYMAILLFPGYYVSGQSSSSLQSMIDSAKPEETIVVPTGSYEGPLVINKALTIQAVGEVNLVNNSKEPAIWITADDVHMKGFTIVDITEKESASILIDADHVEIDHLNIRTASYGIRLNGASFNEIRNSEIVWESAVKREAKLSDKRNGIDLYESHDNRLIGNTISDLHDGIYLERSDRNVVEENQVFRSRYGVHCMYTNGTIIRNNVGSFNITGAMVMAVRDVEVVGNSFYKQNESVNSQGILLFDAHSSLFSDNIVEGNRVGFYIELSSDNTLLRNQVKQNFIGIQFIEASKNRLSEHLFSGNVIEAEARSSADNNVDGNFWDSFRGIDLNGDGRSEITNAINPYFQTVVKARPAFQLFFQSPGMIFLQELFQSERHQWMTDNSPLMEPPADIQDKLSSQAKTGTGIMGALLLIVSMTTIFYLGVRRS
ncbi:MAG: NosD domain-containing protein [Paenibacillaceae bacterium]